MVSMREQCPEKVDDILKRFPQRKTASIPLLYLAWDVYEYVSEDAMVEIAEILNTSPAWVEGVASFYTMFPLKPQGKYHIEVCTNISCHLVGAQDVLKKCESELGIHSGELTEDGKFSLQTVECLASCSWAPCLHVNGKEYQSVSPDKVGEILNSLE
ncbi:NAD(P)H-dependent oxidoreductase subunit E [bacterium]|nr:NAD(P)H-dependent oxidoreductase subunit E [bacterium]